jgi:transposase
MALQVRSLTEQEAAELRRLAHSRTISHRLVQRAQLIWASAQGLKAPAIAAQLGLSAVRVRAWIQRFNAHGLAGLADRPRAGRPRQHDEADRGTVIALARTKPRRLGYPFELWTLARVHQALHERHRWRVAQGPIWKWLQAEGLAWKRQQSWRRATRDAAFVANRGPSSRPPRRRSRGRASSASARWGR